MNSVDDDEMYALTNDDIDRMADEAVGRSYVMNDPPAGHTRGTLGDIARALVLRDLADRHRRGRFFPFVSYYPFAPPFLFPFDGRMHGRRGRH